MKHSGHRRIAHALHSKKMAAEAGTSGEKPIEPQPHGFPAMAQRHHEPPRAPVLAGLRIAHHEAGALVP